VIKMTMPVIAALFLIPVACAVGQSREGALATALKTSYEAEAKGDYEAALKPLAIPSAATSYFAQLRLGWLAYCSKDWNESISHYRQAAQLAPMAVEPLLGQMLPLQAAGRYDDAIRTAQSALRLDSANYTATSRAAWMFYLKQDYRQAAALYRKLVNLYPTDTEMLLGLGFALKADGDKKDSAQCFNTVLLLSPDNSRALAGLDIEASRTEAGKNGGRIGSGVERKGGGR
jgi:tetratricopeptide (TPR) repeat protein